MASANWPGKSRELDFALSICRQAGQLALKYFYEGTEVAFKDDDTPVTRADKECERLIREGIAREFPGDDIIGEEEGASSLRAQASTARKWIVDPIDGTYNYARGVPVFSTLLALEINGEIVIGVVHAPGMGETFWAEKGGGAYKNGQIVHVSTLNELARSQFNFGAPSRILDEGLWPGFTSLIAATYRQRCFGDYLGFTLVFEGKAEAVLEVGVKVWDLAPMKVIAEEAGGRFSDLKGGQSIYTGSCLITNGYLHEEVLATLVDREDSPP